MSKLKKIVNDFLQLVNFKKIIDSINILPM